MRKKTLLIPTLALLAFAPSASALTSDQVDADSGLKAKPSKQLVRAQAVSRPGTPKPKPAAPKPVAVPAALQSIASCESGGNPQAVSSNGQYRGKYQFDTGTWASVGGSGDPAAAPEAEQDRRAMVLYARSGPGQWPVCSQ